MDIYDAIEVSPGVWEPAIAAGLYPDMTNEAYHASKGVSKSHLDDICIEHGFSPLHYWDKRVNPDQPPPKEKEEHLILGDAIHKAILEPDLMSGFAFVPEDAPAKPTEAMKNSKNPSISSQDRVSWWADFERENEGKRILPVKMHKALIGARDAVHMHPAAKHLFKGGNAEQTFFATDPVTGALIKCRTDYDVLEREAMIVDLKTTDDAAPKAFEKSMRNFRYDVQDPWYRHVIHSAFDQQDIVRKFVFVAVEKVRPFAVGIYWIEDDDRQQGMALARRDLDTILACRQSNMWPDFGCKPQLLRVNRRPL